MDDNEQKGFTELSEFSTENWQEKTLCVLLLDNSGSMKGEKMENLNEGLNLFYNRIINSPRWAERIEIAIISFDSEVHYHQLPAIAENFTMPTLTAMGGTNMVGGIKKAIEVVEERKQYYRNQGIAYKCPWIIMITDCYDADVDSIKDQLKKDQENRRYYFLPLAIDENADTNILNTLTTITWNSLSYNKNTFDSLFLDTIENGVINHSIIEKADDSMLESPFSAFSIDVNSDAFLPGEDKDLFSGLSIKGIHEEKDSFCQEKTLCVILIDHSELTYNNIANINQTLHVFYEDILKSDSLSPRLEIGLVSCNAAIGIIQRPSLVENITMPTLKAEGMPNLIDGIKNAVEVVEERKKFYRDYGIAYKRPWIIIISNGECDAESIKNNLKQIVTIRDEARTHRFVIQPIAIDDNADLVVLDTIATMKTIYMKDAIFSDFFMWLSKSMAGNYTPLSYDTSEQVENENPFSII